MNRNKITVYDDKNIPIVVEVFLTFKIKEYNKEYIVYTLNDDGKSEMVNVHISQIDSEGDKPKIVPIPEEEARMVLSFYDYIRDHITGARDSDK